MSLDLSDGIFYKSCVSLADFSSYVVAIMDPVIRNITAISIHSFDELFMTASDQTEILHAHAHAHTHMLHFKTTTLTHYKYCFPLR